MVIRIIQSKNQQNQCFLGRTDIFKCYENYIMRPHRPHMLQSMPGHYQNIITGFTE